MDSTLTLARFKLHEVVRRERSADIEGDVVVDLPGDFVNCGFEAAKTASRNERRNICDLTFATNGHRKELDG